MVNINGFVCLWQVLPRGVGLFWHFASPKTRVGLPKPSTITIQLGVEWQHVLPATTALNVQVLSYVCLQWNSSGEETLFQNLPCSACKVIDAMARVHEDLWETTLRVITCGQFYPDSLTYQLSTYYLSNAIIDPCLYMYASWMHGKPCILIHTTSGLAGSSQDRRSLPDSQPHIILSTPATRAYYRH